jgi:C4-dicarboxylate-specific signal transduction histidine kinase
VRADPATAGVRIAMLTAKLAEDERVAALSAGIDDFLGKPFSLAELAARLRNLGGRARAERALRAANTALAAGNLALAQTRALLIQDEKLKSIGVLAAGLIHEINNPVSYMRTAAELLRRRPGIGADAGAAELLASIEQGLQRVGTLIGDLRVFAYRGAADDARHAAQRIDLRTVVASALRLTAAQLRGIAVHQDLVESFVAGAPSQLVQVVVNLLTNAADALRAGATAAPRIGIVLRRPAPDQVELRVQDNGPGIAPAVAARLFEPFFTTREVGKGLGLGLAVSQAIVRAHEGQLQVDDRPGPAQGACFVVSLPAA